MPHDPASSPPAEGRFVRPAPALIDPALAPLLEEPFASAWAPPAGAGPAAPDAAALRDRLARRLAASQRAEAGFTTVRRRSAPCQVLAPGVQAQWLYRTARPAGLRPGEPLRAGLVELAPGATWAPSAPDDAPPGAALHREWLVMAGAVQAPGLALAAHDYHAVPAGLGAPAWHSAAGALLFLRESLQAARPGDAPLTVRDAEAGWPAYAPGIDRRVLWQRDGQAALLYRAAAGAQVPPHRHGHDEECLMVQGELFLDDRLLQAGDYQLAPAGSGHHTTATDTGVVLYAHGDLDLQFTG